MAKSRNFNFRRYSVDASTSCTFCKEQAVHDQLATFRLRPNSLMELSQRYPPQVSHVAGAHNEWADDLIGGVDCMPLRTGLRSAFEYH